MNDLEKELSEKLSEDIEGTLLECIKTTIDTMCEVVGDEVINKIPIVNIGFGIIHTIEGVHKQNSIRQTFTFLENLRKNKVSKEKLHKYKKKFYKNENKQKEELEKVLLYLEKNIEIEKSELLANFFVSYIEGEIDWDGFCEFATVLDRMFVNDFKKLYEIYENKITKNKADKNVVDEAHKIGRLIANGLLSNYSGAITVREMSGANSGVRLIYETNTFGRKFVEIARRNENPRLEE